MFFLTGESIIDTKIEECQFFFYRICVECAASPQSALDILQQENNSNQTMRKCIPTSINMLDEHLHGGFKIGTVSEIVGRAGVGKTQLAMQLCIMAAKFGQGSIYIDTEQKMSLNRMQEIAQKRYAMNENLPDSQNVFPYKTPSTVLQNVIIHSPRSTNQMESIISKLEEEILMRNRAFESSSVANASIYPVRLLLVDSIAAPTRRDFGKESAHDRVSALFRISQMLKRIADQLRVAVVVINQIGFMNNNKNILNNALDGSDRSIIDRNSNRGDHSSVSAALGVSWHHCVSTRLLLEHTRDSYKQIANRNMAQGNNQEEKQNSSQTIQRGFVRSASVVKSNIVGYSKICFEISDLGICEHQTSISRVRI